MKVTSKLLQQTAALQWDVDISDAAAGIMLPEVIEASGGGISHLSYDRATRAVQSFLYDLLGAPCYINNQTGEFVPSEFVQNSGKTLDVGDLPQKQWKTIDEINAPERQPGKSRRRLETEPPSEKLIELNEKLLKAGTSQEVIEKFQMQLQLIADCGFEIDEEITVNKKTDETQTFFSLKNAGRTAVVDLVYSRCAIRLFDTHYIEKVYAHRKREVLRVIDWLKTGRS